HVITGPPIPSNPNGVATTITCDCAYERFPESYCDPLHCTSLAWDKQLGVVTTSTDENSQATTFGYDPLGRLTSLIYPVSGSFERWIWPTIKQWNTPLQALRHEISDGSAGDGVLWDRIAFDGLGRPTQLLREGGILEDSIGYEGLSDRVVK